MAGRSGYSWWVLRTLLASLTILAADGVDAGNARVSYLAVDQDVATLITGLGTLSGERYQPDVDLLVAGINATKASLALVDSGPDACRQALAFALDCWWVRSEDGTILLSTNPHLPCGNLEVRTITSTLRRKTWIQPLAERLLAPWLGGQAGLSYLPSEGLWTATLDPEGHRRLIEFLSLCERPLAQATSRVPDPSMPDLRRLTASDVSARAWPTLVNGLAQAVQAPVTLSPRLRLQTCPDVRLPRQSLAAVAESLRALGLSATWCRGVLCLGEASLATTRIERQHPADRRHLALIPIDHLLGSALDGELVVAALRRHVAAGWWDMPGAGIEYLADTGSLLVAGDVDAQQAVLAAVSAIDSLGLELGLQTIAAGAR